MNKMKIVLTGGGTGGHIVPNIALLPYLKRHFEIYYLGNKDSLEQDLMKEFPFVRFIETKAVKFVRKLTFKNLLIPFKLLKYINETKKILQKINPNVIFAKGGFVSIPVVYAGAKLNIPIFAHESDYSMGLANKLIARKCKIMFTSFKETCRQKNCVYSGSPVRQEILKGNKEVARKICNFENNLPIVLFFGGSLGSKKINNFVFENIKNLSHYNIIHIVGKNNLNNIKAQNYYQIEYTSKIQDFFALSDIVVCRGGSNSIFELLELKKIMIIIPLSKEQSRGDQIENALIFKKNGWAKIIYEDKLNISSFKVTLNNCINSKSEIISKLNSYKKQNATLFIARTILDNITKKD